jgi:nonsense-mediated mRNA decay protein 3
VCGVCRSSQLSWFSCRRRVTSIICPACNSRKEAGLWADSATPREELGYDLARRGIHIISEVTDPVISISIRDQSVNRSVADCRISGKLLGEPVEGTCQIEILWQKEQCDRCSRMAGSYHEGEVQVRATGRKPSPGEIHTAGVIAREVEEAFFSSGERLSFISDIQETRDGLDITIGSQRIGHEISSAIVKTMGGRFTTHPKLVGERAGKRLYRITYSVRLPRYSRGDIIRIRGNYGEVQRSDGKEIRYTEIPGGQHRSAGEDKVESRIGNIRDAREYLVTFRQGETLGILHPESGESRECSLPPGMQVEAGDKVRVFQAGEEIILWR